MENEPFGNSTQNFFGRCWRFSYSGMVGVLGDMTLLLGIVGAALSGHDSQAAQFFIAYIDLVGGWTALITLGLVILILRFLYAAHQIYSMEHIRVTKLEDEMAPKMDLFFERTDIGCYRPNTPMSWIDPSNSNASSPAILTDYWRLKCRPKGSHSVLDCRGKIVGVKIGHRDIYTGENLWLTFDRTAPFDPLCRNIHNKSEDHLDVICITQFSHIHICTLNFVYPSSLHYNPIWPNGDYLIEIVVTASNSTSETHTLLFIWRGNWKTAIFSTIPKSNAPQTSQRN